MYDKIIKGEYDNKLEWPKPVTPLCPQCLFGLSQFDKFCKNCGVSVQDHIEKRLSEYYAQQTRFEEEKHRLIEKFKRDLLEHYSLSDHPKKDKIFDHVWKRRLGLSAIYDLMGDLCHLFIDDDVTETI